MKLTVLTDNSPGYYLLAEHGLSYLLEITGRQILFDTGQTDVFLQNARKLNLNIPKLVDTVVLSHGHYDHGNGLRHLSAMRLITHPSAFIKRYGKGKDIPIGLDQSREELESKFTVITSEDPWFINDQIIFSGGIPRLNDFESQETSFCDEYGNDDFVPDDAALFLIEDGELIIVSGCAHSGICNMVEHAVKVTGINRIRAVIGGFHLKDRGHQTMETIRYLKDRSVGRVMPSHCTELDALVAFRLEFGIRQLKTGAVLEI